MQKPLQITVRDVPRSDALEGHIRERAEKLELFHPHMTGCRVLVQQPHRHKHQGKKFNVRLDITVPGGEVVVDREEHEDVYVALRDAFDAAKRQLEDHARRQRGNVKLHEPAARGRVLRINREEGYGFIEASDGTQVYFSRENLVTPDFDHLAEGAEVQFLQEAAAEGVQAKRVSVGKHHGTG